MESPEFIDVQGLRALYVHATLVWQESQAPKAWADMCRAGLDYRAAAYSEALQGFLWAEAQPAKVEGGTSQQRALACNGLKAALQSLNKALDALAAAEELVQSLG